MKEDIIKKAIFIEEETYQKYKLKSNKNIDYFSLKEYKALMQFLMQRQRKVIKNEIKI